MTAMVRLLLACSLSYSFNVATADTLLVDATKPAKPAPTKAAAGKPTKPAAAKPASAKSAAGKPTTNKAVPGKAPAAMPPPTKSAATKPPAATAKPAPAADADDDRRIAGDEMSTTVSGFYDNPSWGKMLIQIDGSRFYGTYAYRHGTVAGTVDKATGLVKAVWCESDSEEQSPRPYHGLAEFVFEKGDAAKVNLKGKWKPGGAAATPWKDDWNLTKVAGTPPAELAERMKKKGKAPLFCDKP